MVTSPQVMKNLSESVQKMQKQQKKSRSQHHQTPPTPRSSTGGGGGGGSANSLAKKAHHHQQQSSPAFKKSLSFATPIKTPTATPSSSNRSSATPSPRSCYAGSKCYEPPTPESLPKPPPAWTGPGGEDRKAMQLQSPLQALVSSMQRQEQRQMDSRDSNEAVSQHLKLLLKVNA